MKDAESEYSYADVNRRANRLAHALRSEGLTHGDTVAVLLSNRAEWGEVMYGCFRAGVVPGGINFMFSPEQTAYAVDAIDADLFLFDTEFADTVDAVRPELSLENERFIALGSHSDYRRYDEFLSSSSASRPLEGIGTDEDAVIWFTSGTTGNPKPLVWTQASLVNHFSIHAFSLGLNEDDYSLLLMPFFHGNSQAYFMSQLYLGGSVYVHRGREFDPAETLDILEREGITFTSMVPTHYNQIVHDTDLDAYDLSTLDTVLSSSAPLSRSLKREIIESMDCQVVESYGSTEAGMPVMLRPHDQLRKIGSIGTALPGCDVMLLDEETNEPVETGEIGVIYMRMPFGMDRYYGLPEKTEAVTLVRDGVRWMTANDMGRFDDDGFLYMINRKNDMIITGGENVYPTHIEEVLYEHPEIKDAAVIGVPDEKWGEAVHAVVVPTERSSLDIGDLREFCRDRVADYERPQGLDIVDELPRTSTGKVQRGEIRKRFWDGVRDYSEL